MNNNCLFCKIIDGQIPSTKVYEDESVLAFKDINPAAPIHILVIPKKHYVDFTEMDDDIILKVNKVANNMKNLIYDKLNADGIKLVNNYGIEQVVKHYHLHIIPIYKEDEILTIEEVYDKLKK